MFVVPPLGGIEAATKPQVPVKTGTTNGEYRIGGQNGEYNERERIDVVDFAKSPAVFSRQGILANPTTDLTWSVETTTTDLSNPISDSMSVDNR